LRQQRKILYDALLRHKHRDLYQTRIQRRPWLYYAIVASLTGAIVALCSGHATVALAGLTIWLILTARFTWRRLRHNSLRLRHVVEMVLTSTLIPPLALFWRVYGSCRYGVWLF